MCNLGEEEQKMELMETNPGPPESDVSVSDDDSEPPHLHAGYKRSFDCDASVVRRPLETDGGWRGRRARKQSLRHNPGSSSSRRAREETVEISCT